ncbi:RNase H family protein [Acinetobacter baumannii]|uniref:RNase H type-1 domain-containing protein n=1 Tax=Acinetobacter baumannii TaxID=470 RepID=A0A9P2LAL9_ACIBA|nr:RNase H family protein [Acinetobacter baumannii]EKT7961224.1 hypothetical protein [Acinetobacter baumannii]EKT9125791.1 hypothetical protein [Acinetobacter baumannii]EKT9272677.1 hypothetical protein [Acinetobacter baumannii]EKT9314725.1 hypothetical protein [Acinetobacter baumannii]EKU0110711.1 hypothetical protein [Acinetobacter baumannii]
MNVTLMTDASHCPETGAGGFGFWCVSDRGKLAGGKPLQGKIKDSYEAEMKAVANALNIGIRAGLISSGDKVLIQLDNTGVIQCIKKKCKPRNDVKHVLDYIFEYARDFLIELECRHVKGHSKKTESRYSSNKHCDRIAKQNMRLARKELGAAA